MRRLTLLGITAVAIVAFIASNLTAQDQPSRVVYLNSQAAIHAHPSGAQLEGLNAQAREEIGGLVQSISALEQKAASGQQLTPEEAERYATLQTTIQAVDARYKEEIAAAAEPARMAVDQAIKELAVELNYTMVLDSLAAYETGLVVYADPALDITDLVIERVKGM